MPFYGIWSVPISITRAIPWNSMELRVRQFRWHERFHGIPWNWECTNFDGTGSSMEFHGTCGAPFSLTRAVPWSSIYILFNRISRKCITKNNTEFHAITSKLEFSNHDYEQFHGTWSAPISLTRAVAWNSMELGVRQFSWHEQFRGIPWNSIGILPNITVEQFWMKDL